MWPMLHHQNLGLMVKRYFKRYSKLQVYTYCVYSRLGLIPKFRGVIGGHRIGEEEKNTERVKN